jgi:hypothetical protein
MFTVNTDEGKTTTYRDGKPVSSYTQEGLQRRRGQRRPIISDPSLFVGPKLKIERAKRHTVDLETTAKAFFDTHPYQFVREIDANTGENVLRVLVKERAPVSMSGILGDAVHNLRCVYDYLVCDLIRNNGNKPDGNSGLPIKRKAERFKPGSIPKIDGVSSKAERYILLLKANKRANAALWAIHWLDIIDKHNAIVPVAAATIQVTAKVGVPGMFLGPDGNIRLGGPGPGGVPMLVDAGTPDQFRRVALTQGSVEIHRSPGGFQEEVRVSLDIAFSETQVAEGEPVIETLRQLTEFTERALNIFERRAL